MTMNDSWGYQKADDNWKIAADRDSQSDHVLARHGQLSAEYRAET